MGSSEDEKADQEARQDGNYPTVETWGDRDSKLVVTQRDGFTCKVSLQTKVNTPPEELYDILTMPDNSHIFRNVKRITFRKVLEDDKQGRQLVEVEQEAKWKFLLFGGTFRTRLYVHQNRNTRHVEFRLTPTDGGGLMKRFEGTWRIQPFTQAALDEASGFEGGGGGRHHWARLPITAITGIQRRMLRQEKSDASLLTLEQSLLPSIIPPPPLDRLLKGIASRQVRNLIEDVQREVDRRRAETERNKPHPSTSAAPLASLSLQRHLFTNLSAPRRVPASLALQQRALNNLWQQHMRPLTSRHG